MEILDELKRDTIQNLVAAGKRAEDRGMFDYRDISVEKDILEFSDGSALVRLGKTQVLCAIKFDTAVPFPDRPEEGILSVSAELMPLASQKFEPGPPDEQAIELARVVDRGIRAAELIDFKKFFITEGKVLALYFDIYVLDYDGNLIDAAGLAAMAALQCTKMPKIEDEAIKWGEYIGPLELKDKTVTTHTFAKIGGSILLDPCLDEEAGMDAKVTFGIMGDNSICAIQKSGPGSFQQGELEKVMDIAFKKNKELKDILEKT